ncbi:MAG TPA: hypothetical protein VLJ59_04790, partial [Mycobacteriales bacterium]|nr:hypothetical protein [Mycobacteriales bacterium]
ADGQLTPADPGHEDEPATFTTPSKKPPNAGLTIDQQTYNAVHDALRRLDERASSLPKTTFTAPRRYRGCPWRPSDIAATALALPHHEHDHTTRPTTVNHTTRQKVTRKGSVARSRRPSGG